MPAKLLLLVFFKETIITAAGNLASRIPALQLTKTDLPPTAPMKKDGRGQNPALALIDSLSDAAPNKPHKDGCVTPPPPAIWRSHSPTVLSPDYFDPSLFRTQRFVKPRDLKRDQKSYLKGFAFFLSFFHVFPSQHPFQMYFINRPIQSKLELKLPLSLKSWFFSESLLLPLIRPPPTQVSRLSSFHTFYGAVFSSSAHFNPASDIKFSPPPLSDLLGVVQSQTEKASLFPSVFQKWSHSCNPHTDFCSGAV